MKQYIVRLDAIQNSVVIHGIGGVNGAYGFEISDEEPRITIFINESYYTYFFFDEDPRLVTAGEEDGDPTQVFRNLRQIQGGIIPGGILDLVLAIHCFSKAINRPLIAMRLFELIASSSL